MSLPNFLLPSVCGCQIYNSDLVLGVAFFSNFNTVLIAVLCFVYCVTLGAPRSRCQNRIRYARDD